MNKAIMDAEAARMMSKANAMAADDEALKHCEGKIIEACKQGKRAAYVPSGYLTHGAAVALKNMGYKIDFYQPDDEYTISW